MPHLWVRTTKLARPRIHLVDVARRSLFRPCAVPIHTPAAPSFKTLPGSLLTFSQRALKFALERRLPWALSTCHCELRGCVSNVLGRRYYRSSQANLVTVYVRTALSSRSHNGGLTTSYVASLQHEQATGCVQERITFTTTAIRREKRAKRVKSWKGGSLVIF